MNGFYKLTLSQPASHHLGRAEMIFYKSIAGIAESEVYYDKLIKELKSWVGKKNTIIK
jgi:hypothetical protein